MREIKFRAWDRKTKRMVFKVAGYSSTREEIPIDQVGESEYGEDPFFAVQFEVVYKEVFEGKETMVVEYILYDQIFHNDRFVPMEFTGLKDSKGKEIYEGDIVRISDNHTEVINWIGDGDWMGEKQPLVGFIHHASIYKKPIEVIGNLYENPNLLSQDK